jgi:hypothetical protein
MNLRIKYAFLSIAFTCSLCAQATAPDLRGIFIYTNDVSQITTPTANCTKATLLRARGETRRLVVNGMQGSDMHNALFAKSVISGVIRARSAKPS